MDRIIFDPADDPNEGDDWRPAEEPKLKELRNQIDVLLDEYRPDRYIQNDTAWMSPVIQKAKELIGADTLDQLVTRAADSLVHQREAVAKRRAASFFREVSGQMALGEGTQTALDFLGNARNLPVKINGIDVVRIGALKQEDYADLRMTRDNEKKLFVDAADREIGGIDAMYELVRSSGVDNLDSLF